MLLEDAPGSIAPVRARSRTSRCLRNFASSSYAKRYEILLTKLVRERLYDSACFLMSNRETGPAANIESLRLS